MWRISLRAILLCSVLCGVLVAGVVAFGSLSTTMLATGYHDNEGVTYTVYVEDIARDFRMNLAGTRCFGPLPPWVYSADVEASRDAPDIGRSYTHGSRDGAALVGRLGCR